MKTFCTFRLCLVLWVIAAFLTACGGSASSTYKNRMMNFGAIQSVAVLPFQNLTADEDAAPRARDTFMGMLLATETIYVLPPGEVERGIERAGLRNPATPSVEKIQSLGQILEVDAVVTGVLREYGPVRSGQSEANLISLSLQMMEVDTGTIIWSADATRGGIGLDERLFGGGGTPMNEVTKEAVDDLLDQLFQ